MTQENRISKKIPSESPLAVVYQKPEASSPTNDSKMLETKNEWMGCERTGRDMGPNAWCAIHKESIKVRKTVG